MPPEKSLLHPENLSEICGQIDIYLFDQILKGRLLPHMRILDAGCGGGRNLVYFLRSGFEVCAVDESENAISAVRNLATQMAPALNQRNFRQEKVGELSFPDDYFDAVISNAVLHFVPDEAAFKQALHDMWRVLKSGGLFFCRLASSIGLEERIQLVTGRRFRLPDGSERFLVDLDFLLQLTNELGGELLEPVKTTNVQNLRCMTTWCLTKA